VRDLSRTVRPDSTRGFALSIPEKFLEKEKNNEIPCVKNREFSHDKVVSFTRISKIKFYCKIQANLFLQGELVFALQSSPVKNTATNLRTIGSNSLRLR